MRRLSRCRNRRRAVRCSSSLEQSVQLGPELVDQCRSIRTLRTPLQPPQQLRIADQYLAQVLAGAENEEEDLGRSNVVRQLVERRVDPRHRGHEPFEIDKGHPGIGTARQDRVELHDNPGEPIQAPETGAVRQVARSRAPRSGSRTPSPLSQWRTRSGSS